MKARLQAVSTLLLIALVFSFVPAAALPGSVSAAQTCTDRAQFLTAPGSTLAQRSPRPGDCATLAPARGQPPIAWCFNRGSRWEGRLRFRCHPVWRPVRMLMYLSI